MTSGLTKKIILERDLCQENILAITGLDGGNGFMQIYLTLFDFNEGAPSSSQKAGKSFKHLGVKKGSNEPTDTF